MATELIGPARQEANKETVKRHPRLARASATLAVAAGGLAANADVRVDEAGRIHVTSDKAVQDPPSLVDLRKRVAAMLPRVDIGEQILEVMGWVPEFLESLTALSGRAARMADLNVTVAACLTGQALNIGDAAVSPPGVPARAPPRTW